MNVKRWSQFLLCHMHVWKIHDPNYKWSNSPCNERLYQSTGFYQPHCFSFIHILFIGIELLRIVGNKFPLCVWHTHSIFTLVVWLFANGMWISLNRECVSVAVNFETVSHSLYSCSFNGWLRSEWVKKGRKKNHHGKFYAQNDKLIVYCFWLRKWLLSCDTWLTTIILWNVHNNTLLFFFSFSSPFSSPFFLHVSAGAPFLIKLLMLKHRSSLFACFVAFVYSIFLACVCVRCDLWNIISRLIAYVHTQTITP